MQNHDQKARDIARSALPSSARRGARKRRRHIHHIERARLRQELAVLRRLDDPIDHEGDLRWQARGWIAEMVQERQQSDKLGPLTRWAEHKQAHDPFMVGAPDDAQRARIRALLPGGLVGGHAAGHAIAALRISPHRRLYGWSSTRSGVAVTTRDRVLAILGGGYHGHLNDALRAATPQYRYERIWVPDQQIDDPEAPTGHRLVRGHWADQVVEQRPRLLLGRHDVDAFLTAPSDGPWRSRARGDVVAAVYADLVARRAIPPVRVAARDDADGGRHRGT